MICFNSLLTIRPSPKEQGARAIPCWFLLLGPNVDWKSFMLGLAFQVSLDPFQSLSSWHTRCRTMYCLLTSPRWKAHVTGLRAYLYSVPSLSQIETQPAVPGLPEALRQFPQEDQQPQPQQSEIRLLVHRTLALKKWGLWGFGATASPISHTAGRQQDVVERAAVKEPDLSG